MKSFFIAGTDTGIGKTYVTCQLLHYWNARGLNTAALKPIASGCEHTDDGLRNADALALQTAASVQLPYHLVNPIALPDAIAPHIAAKKIEQSLTVANTKRAIQKSMQTNADMMLVEGVGGWLVPLNTQETMADLVAALNLPVLLVIGIRLGCLNHALLTVQAIENSNTPLAGWIANIIEPNMSALTENITTLKQHISAKHIGNVEYNGSFQPHAPTLLSSFS